MYDIIREGEAMDRANAIDWRGRERDARDNYEAND
jgi:hypothetical protein